MAMLRYGLYCRKSDKEDGDVIKSIEDQKSYWLENASRLGLVVAKVYEENKSAKTPHLRPIYDGLLRDLRSGKIDAILVWHINRLARNMAEGGHFAQLLMDGVIKEVRSATSIYTPSDNILPLLIEQGMATQYSRDLSRTVTLAITEMAKAGGWPHKALLGYINARDPMNMNRGIIVRDPERFELVRRGMELMMSDIYSVRQVIDEMNRWGLRTRTTDRHSGTQIGYSHAYDMFRNPFYAGFIRHKGILCRGKHEPMLTPAEFNRLQRIMDRRSRTCRRGASFVFTGYVQCGLCGFGITTERRTKRGRTYIYYHCSDPYGKCTKRAVTEPVLLEEFMKHLSSVQIDDESADLARIAIKRWLGMKTRDLEIVAQSKKNRIAEIVQERSRLVSLLAKGVITDEDLFKHTDGALEAEWKELTLSDRTQGELALRIEANVGNALEFASRAMTAFLTVNKEAQRAIIAALGSKYVLAGKELQMQVDPLLEQIVKFAKELTTQKSAQLEPLRDSSWSTQRLHFSQAIRYGCPTTSQLEPSEELIRLLEDHSFPAVFEDSPQIVHSQQDR